jgi:hypothetical protein
MKHLLLVVLAGAIASLHWRGAEPVSGAVPSHEPKALALDHRTLDFCTEGEGWRRYELTATVTDEKGEGKLRLTLWSPDGVTRDLFGDRTGKGKPVTTTHDITLIRIKSVEDLPQVPVALAAAPERKEADKDKNLVADPSPGGGRRLYRVDGPNYGTNRALLLVVSPGGFHRLVYIGRCSGPYAATLEPRESYDGPGEDGK